MPKADPVVISIQSQVVHGKVGNSAAVPVLQAHGLIVAAVPTTLLSNHPHYPTMRGRVLPADLLGELLTGVEERGLADAATLLITGFLGSVENGDAVAGFVAQAKRRNPGLVYVCDPVCGDDDLGAFVDPRLQRLFAESLLPLSDIATPNAWELRALTGCEDLLDGARSLQARGPSGIVVTAGNSGDGELRTLVADKVEAWQIRSPRLDVRPAGTGDLFTACLGAKLARGRSLVSAAEAAVAATHAVLERTALDPWSEMPIEACLAQTVAPPQLFLSESLGGSRASSSSPACLLEGRP